MRLTSSGLTRLARVLGEGGHRRMEYQLGRRRRRHRRRNSRSPSGMARKAVLAGRKNSRLVAHCPFRQKVRPLSDVTSATVAGVEPS